MTTSNESMKNTMSTSHGHIEARNLLDDTCTSICPNQTTLLPEYNAKLLFTHYTRLWKMMSRSRLHKPKCTHPRRSHHINTSTVEYNTQHEFWSTQPVRRHTHGTARIQHEWMSSSNKTFQINISQMRLLTWSSCKKSYSNPKACAS